MYDTHWPSRKKIQCAEMCCSVQSRTKEKGGNPGRVYPTDGGQQCRKRCILGLAAREVVAKSNRRAIRGTMQRVVGNTMWLRLGE